MQKKKTNKLQRVDKPWFFWHPVTEQHGKWKKKKWSKKSTQIKVQCKQTIFNKKNLANTKYLHREKKKKKNNFLLPQIPISYTESTSLKLDKCIFFFNVRFILPFVFLHLGGSESLGYITKKKGTILQKHANIILGDHLTKITVKALEKQIRKHSSRQPPNWKQIRRQAQQKIALNNQYTIQVKSLVKPKHFL